MKARFLCLPYLVLLVGCDAPEPKPRGETVYNQSCVSCHERGHGGAPIRGDQQEWAKKLEKSRETLVDNVIKGYKTMPAKGACFSCTDEDIRLAVEYLLEPNP